MHPLEFCLIPRFSPRMSIQNMEWFLFLSLVDWLSEDWPSVHLDWTGSVKQVSETIGVAVMGEEGDCNEKVESGEESFLIGVVTVLGTVA